MAAAKGNQYALGCTTSGRPAKFKTAQELEDKITEYFQYCQGEYKTETRKVKRKRKDEETGKMKMVEVDEDVTICIRPEERPTWTRLALYLGFESRQSLTDLKEREEFSYPIKRALLIIESIYEDSLTSSAVAGVIFALKNLGWKDQTDINHSGKVDTSDNLSALSDDELQARINKLKKAGK